MNFLKTGLLSLILATLTLLSGCSDLFQKDVDDKALQSNKFKANCELNIDEFALIMEEPIEEAIDCLGKNLKLFIKAVESKRPGYLSRKALENYIKRNRKDIKPEVLRALKSVFDINYLVYGEDRDFISEANVDALVKFAKIFNEKASTNFKPIFMEESDIDYENYRVQRDQRIKPAALVVSSALRDIFNSNHKDGTERELDINGLLDSFTTESNTTSMSNIKKILFLKKVVLGGSKTTLTHKELGRLIDNFSSYILLALDGVRYKNIRMNQESMVHFLNSDVELLNSLIFSSAMPDRSKETFFTLDQILDAVDIFLGDDNDLNLRAYYDLLKEAKVILMDGSPTVVTGGDLRRLISKALELLKTGTYFHRFWASERVLLETRPGRPLDAYKFESLYDIFKSEKKRVDDFVRILKKYRFQRGENLSAYYTDDYYRNANGVYEVAIYEYVLTLVMKHFGCPNNTLGGTVACDGVPVLNEVYMKKEHVVNLVQRFKKVLLENDLILPGREVKTAETITLLGSLFQYQSDENKVFDVNEATEFAISLFTAIDISEDLQQHFLALKKKGKCDMDIYDRVSPECFDAHFFEGVCMNYPDQFPKLYKSLGAEVYKDKKLVCNVPQTTQNLAYLDRSVLAARTCNEYPDTQEKIYYSKSDMMSIFLAMMHIETTIIRWDVRNKNNIMDPAEVMDAYNIYSPALDGFLEKMPGLVKKLKKQIYQYLVKYEKVPNEKEFSSILKFVKFLLSFNKDAPANRKTVASILVTISEQGTPSTFDCNCLHDPRRTEVQRCQAEAQRRQAQPASVALDRLSAPTLLTRSDEVLYHQVESQSDSVIERFLSDNWPDFFRF